MEMESKNYLRTVVSDDVDLIFNWSNDKAVRMQSFSSQPIKWEEHALWFSNILKENNILFYILTSGGHDVGQVRLKLLSSVAQISYSIAENYRNKGFGKLILQLIEEKLFDMYGMKYILEGEVKQSNIVSNKLFLQLGYNKYRETEDYVVYRKNLRKNNI